MKVKYSEACDLSYKAGKRVKDITLKEITKLTGRNCHVVVIIAVEPDSGGAKIMCHSSFAPAELPNILEEVAGMAKAALE